MQKVSLPVAATPTEEEECIQGVYTAQGCLQPFFFFKFYRPILETGANMLGDHSITE